MLHALQLFCEQTKWPLWYAIFNRLCWSRTHGVRWLEVGMVERWVERSTRWEGGGSVGGHPQPSQPDTNTHDWSVSGENLRLETRVTVAAVWPYGGMEDALLQLAGHPAHLRCPGGRGAVGGWWPGGRVGGGVGARGAGPRAEGLEGKGKPSLHLGHLFHRSSF